MHRIDGPGALPGGLFTDGDPSIGMPATVVTDSWANAVQEEIAGVVEGAGLALSKPDNAQLLKALRVMLAALVPAGAVAPFARAVAPGGWLACDGSAVSRTAYPALFTAIGTLFGAGDGATTFNLPDLRGEFVRGVDGGRGVDAGRALGSAQGAAFASHQHMLPASDPALWDGAVFGYASGQPNRAVEDFGGTVVSSSRELTSAEGGSETRPRNVALLYCIKV